MRLLGEAAKLRGIVTCYSLFHEGYGGEVLIVAALIFTIQFKRCPKYFPNTSAQKKSFFFVTLHRTFKGAEQKLTLRKKKLFEIFIFITKRHLSEQAHNTILIQFGVVNLLFLSICVKD